MRDRESVPSPELEGAAFDKEAAFSVMPSYVSALFPVIDLYLSVRKYHHTKYVLILTKAHIVDLKTHRELGNILHRKRHRLFKRLREVFHQKSGRNGVDVFLVYYRYQVAAEIHRHFPLICYIFVFRLRKMLLSPQILPSRCS